VFPRKTPSEIRRKAVSPVVNSVRPCEHYSVSCKYRDYFLYSVHIVRPRDYCLRSAIPSVRAFLSAPSVRAFYVRTVRPRVTPYTPNLRPPSVRTGVPPARQTVRYLAVPAVLSRRPRLTCTYHAALWRNKSFIVIISNHRLIFSRDPSRPRPRPTTVRARSTVVTILLNNRMLKS
jgi:hypothetical protein